MYISVGRSSILQEKNLVRFIKSLRIRWFVDLYRQRDERIKKIMELKPEGVGRRRTSKTREVSSLVGSEQNGN